MKIFQLTPNNGRKSFYGKCQVIEENGISKLQSYETIVAEYNHNTNIMKVFGYYSPTTARHINAFLEYYGFDTCSKKELENYNK
jgi:hypothetical protein